MKKYLWCLLILFIFCPSFGIEVGLLLSIFAVPLAIIMVFVVNGVEIHRALHKDDKEEK